MNTIRMCKQHIPWYRRPIAFWKAALSPFAFAAGWWLGALVLEWMGVL